MARTVKKAGTALPDFPTPADVHEFTGKLWAGEFRHELKKLDKVSQRAVGAYLAAFGFPTAKIPESEAFSRLAEKKSVGELCIAHGLAINCTSAPGAARSQAFNELDNMIGRMIESKGKLDGLALCAFPTRSPEILEIRAAGVKFVAAIASPNQYCILGEIACVFPESYFTKQALGSINARLAFVKPLSKEGRIACEAELLSSHPDAEIIRGNEGRLLEAYRAPRQKQP